MSAHTTLRAAALIALVASCLTMVSDAICPVSPRLRALPRLTLWAWERPEDLRQIDPAATAVALLDRTVSIKADGAVEVRPRMQPVAYPANATRIAVVRIEMQADTMLIPCLKSETLRQAQGSLWGTPICFGFRQAVLDSLLDSARQPGIAAFQVDFDATRRQREFYRELLLSLRREMPPGLPLSMTAFASWCSWDDWIRGLPVDEAVPMFFSMEPDRRSAGASFGEYRLRESLCLGSVGVSTREPWPAGEMASKRIYLFSHRGWRRDLALADAWRLP
jgi:hypothetical protein